MPKNQELFLAELPTVLNCPGQAQIKRGPQKGVMDGRPHFHKVSWIQAIQDISLAEGC